ncbi:MAG: hypothetical protein IT531_08230, partial [Burkholderiales bacterium]|nr:hypothetical protein [Burkholderiales bacterium]
AAPYASFTFQVRDDGGQGGGGLDLDPTPNTLRIDVSALNDAPAVTSPAPTVTNPAPAPAPGDGTQAADRGVASQPLAAPQAPIATPVEPEAPASAAPPSSPSATSAEAAALVATPKDAPSTSGRAAAPQASAPADAPAEAPVVADAMAVKPEAPAAAAVLTADAAVAAAAAAVAAAGAPAGAAPALFGASVGPAQPAAMRDERALLGADFVAQPERSADAVAARELRDALDQVREQVQTSIQVEHRIAAASVAVTGSLSAGYVLWLIRGGVLASSLLSSLPAWRMVDPLPVLAHRGARAKDGEDDESLETIVERNDDEANPNGATPPAEAGAAATARERDAADRRPT